MSTFSAPSAQTGSPTASDSTVRRFTDALPCMVWVRDDRNRLLFVNKTAQRVFGFRPPHGRSRLWTAPLSRDWVDDQGRLARREELPGPLAKVTRRPQQQVTGCIFEGEGIRWLLVQSIPLLRDDGSLEAVVNTATDIADLRESAEAIRLSEARYRRMVDTTHEGICLLDGDSRIAYVNRRMCDMLGYSAETLLGRHTYEFIVGSSGGLGPTVTLGGGGAADEPHDVALRRRDGSIIWSMVTGAAIVDEQGLPTQMLAMFTDVTARKLSEDSVRLREARFRALIENAADVVVILDRTGTVTYESPAMARLLGLDEQSMAGRSAFLPLHPDDLPVAKEAFRSLLEHPGSRRGIDLRFRHVDGTWHWIEGIATSLIDDPAVDGVVANFRDVTERKAAEQRAREAAELLERLTADAVILVDARMHVVSWNQGAERLFGWTKGEVVGQLLPVIPAERRAEARRLQRHLIAAGGTVTNETTRVNKAGELIPVLGSWSVASLPNGKRGVLSIAKDLREHQEMNRRLAEQAESLMLAEERERIAMDLHDGVIQSLYGVALSLGALRRQTETDAQVDTAPAVGQAVAELTDTIEHIREYIFDLRAAIPDEGDLKAGLRALAARAQSNRAGLEAETAITDESLDVPYATVVHLLHITREALSNVVRHAHASRVRLDLTQTTDALSLTVADDGQGFQPDGRGRRLGDGLRNMRERARMIGAEFTIHSAPRRGTRVEVRLRRP
ncbi:MAG: PAS domain S-box protein [Chloroflexi bacterium]|nr:PAS domain S-box protein [Chloroflexota bacterium]